MSKELNVIDSDTTNQKEAIVPTELIKLDDLSLALVGGGMGAVDLG